MQGDRAELARVVGERVRTLEQLIRVCEIDTTEWEVERYICNKWESAMGPRGTGAPVVVELYQIKVWLRRRVALIAARDEVRELIETAKQGIKALPTVRRARARAADKPMLELAIPDLHLGKFAWSPETGHANYDAKIAEQLFEEAVETLLSRTAHHGGFSRILLPIGNDLLHADNKQGTTTRGTPLDTDSRFQRTFKTAREMLVRAIVRLREIAPVDVLVVPGNHDSLSSWQLGDSLECYFHATPDVRIDNAPTSRKYYEHGAVMLMFTHGDKGKRADYPLLMATERPEMFGRTRAREVHLGHKHQEQTTEYHGVKVRTLPALCPPDAWHSENAFTGMLRSAEALVWDRREGLIGLVPWTVVEDAA